METLLFPGLRRPGKRSVPLAEGFYIYLAPYSTISIQTDCGAWPEPEHSYHSKVTTITISLEKSITTSAKYMCDGDYEYTLDENVVNCTDTGEFTEIGKCVKGLFVTKNKCLFCIYIPTVINKII